MQTDMDNRLVPPTVDPLSWALDALRRVWSPLDLHARAAEANLNACGRVRVTAFEPRRAQLTAVGANVATPIRAVGCVEPPWLEWWWW